MQAEGPLTVNINQINSTYEKPVAISYRIESVHVGILYAERIIDL